MSDPQPDRISIPWRLVAMRALAWVVTASMAWAGLQIIGTWLWFQAHQIVAAAFYVASYGVAGFCVIEAIRTMRASRRRLK